MSSTRREFLTGSGAAVLCGGSAASWAIFLEPRWLDWTQHEVRIPGLGPAEDGLRVVHLSDIHCSPMTQPGYIERGVEQINALEPDVVVVTGDLVTEYPEYGDRLCEVLGRLRARRGCYAILGNHDWWLGGPRLSRHLERHGIRHLDNDSLRLGSLRLIGVDDHWTGHDDFDRAMAGVGKEEPKLLLMHSPDLVVPAAEAGVHLALCGHTHGGQVRIPWYGALIVPSKLGYEQGFYSHDGTTMYVNRGYGTLDLRVRTFCRPEVATFTLRAA